MKSLRFDIYLPLCYNDKTAVEPQRFLDTFKELTSKFGGCSYDENNIIGSWIEKETRQQFDDQIRVYHVVCESTDENLQWLRDYKKQLAERFRQLEIFMYYIEVYRL